MKTHRITLALIILVIIQLSFLTAIIMGERQQRLDAAAKTAEKMSSIASTTTDDFFLRYLSIFDTLKSTDFIADQQRPATEKVLQRLNTKYSDIVNFAAVKKDGDFFASGKQLPEQNVPNIKHLEFFQKILAGHDLVVMQPHKGPISNTMVTGVVVPLNNSAGQVNGLIGVSIHFQALIEKWEEFLLDPSWILAVHDGKGEVHYSSSAPAQTETSNEQIYNSLDSDKATIRIDSLSYSLSTSSSTQSGWHFSVFIPTHHSFINFVSMRKDLIILCALMIASLTALSAWLYQVRQWARQLSSEKSKLQQSEERFRQLAENINAVFWISTPNKQTTLYVSPGFSRIWGMSREELYDDNSCWLKSVHEDDRDRVRYAALTKQIAGEYDEKYRIIHPDGSTRWIYDRAFPISDEKGEIYRIVGIAEDISTQVETEQTLRRQDIQLHAVVENSVDAICVSQDGVHTLVNPAYVSIFGYEHEEELLGKQVLEIIAQKKRQQLLNFDSDIANKTVNSSHFETRGVRKDGTEFDIELNLSQFGLDEEQSTLIIIRDITEKKRLEVQLRHAQKMEAVGTLAGGIAHDFNNILSAIIGFTEIAKDDSQPNSAISADLEQVLEAGNRAKGLVQQILTFSHQTDTEYIPLQPASIVRDTIKMLRPSLPATIEIQHNISANTGLIFVDPTQIHQVLMNLCTNAFHAMEKTGGRLEISLKETHLSRDDLLNKPNIIPGRYVQLTITDTGPGIPAEIKEKIFDPYFTTKEIGKGTGMGLAIVHGIVKNCGGFITIYSEAGNGTAFHIFLPVMEQEEFSKGKTEESIAGGSEKILFIDDEKSLAKMGKDMLERLGYHVVISNSGLEALEIFKKQPDYYDLVITDQTMPKMTGSELAAKILNINPDMLIILCTGYSAIVTESEAKDMGIKEFVHKPLSKRDLSKLVRQVLDAH